MKNVYPQIFLVKDRNRWEECKELCEKDKDLVLVLDFGLFHCLSNSGYHVQYVDTQLKPDKLDALNVEMHQFLQKWFVDSQGKCLLHYQGFSIGDALLMNILNDITYFCHFVFHFIEIREINHQQLFAALDDDLISILKKIGIPFTPIPSQQVNKYGSYWFPVITWMKLQLQPSGFKFWLKGMIRRCLDWALSIVDSIKKQPEKAIYIHQYYSTDLLIKHFLGIKSYSVINETYGRNISWWNQRRIYFKNGDDYCLESEKLIKEFESADKYVWHYNQVPISEFLYEIIHQHLVLEVNQAIGKIHSIVNYFKRRRLDLMIPISNLALENRLLMQYCFLHRIPVFTLLNGLQSLSFWFDAKDSNWVNCYGTSIQEDYYQHAPNALPLGDPRMDAYVNKKKKTINREKPIIVIGASGYNPLDLNSFLAVEFDFIHAILQALKELRLSGKEFSLIIKVRPNGYFHSYKELVDEFFSELETTIEQHVAFTSIIEKADLYISFYSQTLFEASLLGIPVIYYKNDKQQLFRPFDGYSEVVTAKSTKELQEKILHFFVGGDEYNSFLETSTMEQYIGPLDGQNTQRNIDFINSILVNYKF